MNASHHNPAENRQFSLAALFEFVTICSFLCAFSGLTGIAPTIYLMALALAVWARLGAAVLLSLMAALEFADWKPTGVEVMNGFTRQLAVCLLAAAICWWYGFRRYR